MPKKFYVGGPICREEHYYVSRDDEINSIVQKLLSHDNYVLLHAHRQAGKSSLLLPITELLEEKEHVVLSISLQGIGSDDNFWKSLCERIHIVHRVEGFKFHDADGFLKFFDWANFEKNVYLMLDEIDQLLSVPKICENFLSALRAMKTMRSTNSKKTFALAGILGIGVFHVSKLILSGSKISPFNTSDLFRLPQPSEEAVCQMFTSFGSDVDLDLAVFGRDIYGRTRGHLGLTSLLGKFLQEWVMGNLQSKNRITIGGWVASLCNSRFAGYLSQSPCIMTILPSLSVNNPISRSARNFVCDLLNSMGSLADPSITSPYLREVIDYLEIEGIVVRIEVGDLIEVQLAAPLLRVVLLSYFNVVDQRRVPNWVQLPMKNGYSRHLELLSCIRQSLPFMDRTRIYHESSLKKNGTPTEFSYHFELYRVLSTMASAISWVVTSEARNAAEGINKRLDIYVASNGSRYGFELIADATKAQLNSHYTDQAKIYKDALVLSELMVVNFISEIPDGNRPLWWFITEDPDITIIHVHLPSEGSYATIMRSSNPEYDEEINLNTSNLQYDTAVDDIAKQMSEVRIDESQDVSGVNFSELRIVDPTKIVVCDITFFLSRHKVIRDLLKAVKEELMESQTDVPLRLYSKTSKTFFSVSNNTIETFSSASESHEDVEVRCGELSWSVTVK
jgi:hypothetical protein